MRDRWAGISAVSYVVSALPYFLILLYGFVEIREVTFILNSDDLYPVRGKFWRIVPPELFGE
jgi:hypothetical protein